MTNDSLIELLPCPFCGHDKPEIREEITGTQYRVRCTDCFAGIATERTEAKAVAAWNTRVNQPGIDSTPTGDCRADIEVAVIENHPDAHARIVRTRGVQDIPNGTKLYMKSAHTARPSLQAPTRQDVATEEQVLAALKLAREFVTYITCSSLHKWDSLEAAEKDIHSGPFWEKKLVACQKEASKLYAPLEAAIAALSTGGNHGRKAGPEGGDLELSSPASTMPDYYGGTKLFSSEISLVNDEEIMTTMMGVRIGNDEADPLHVSLRTAERLLKALRPYLRTTEPVTVNVLENSPTGTYSWDKEANELRFVSPDSVSVEKCARAMHKAYAHQRISWNQNGGYDYWTEEYDENEKVYLDATKAVLDAAEVRYDD